MASDGAFPRFVSFATLPRTRALIRGGRGFALAAGVALAYAVISLIAGAMLLIGPTGLAQTSVQQLSDPGGGWWNYPALLVTAPGGILFLPFFGTLSMILVSIGVGLGMGAGIVLAVRVLRQRRAPKGAGAAGTIAGLTPAMLALVTLGACCSTSAAAAAGIGAIAQSAGSTYNAVVLNSWYLNLFQIAVLAVALLAQERLVAIYADFLAPEPAVSDAVRSTAPARGPGLHGVPAIAVRTFLVAGGTLWGIAGLLEIAAPPSGAPVLAVLLLALWQHPYLGLIVIAAGLAPGELLAVLGRRSLQLPARGLLALAALSVAVGLPPPMPSYGAYGLGNALLGLGSRPGPWAVAPGVGTPLLFAAGWDVAYALLGVAALGIALFPARMLGWIDRSSPTAVSRPVGTGAPLAEPVRSPEPTTG